MAEAAAPGPAAIARVRWGILVLLRTAACALLLLALYRAMMLLGGALQRLSTGNPLFPLWDQNHAAIRPALAGIVLLILSTWIAHRVAPASPNGARPRYWARVGVRATVASTLLLAAWTGYADVRAVWKQWEFMRSGSIQVSRRSGGMAPPTTSQALASAMSRARPSVPLLVLGGALLAAQRPLIRLLTPPLNGCPNCGYDVDESKQARCPECGLTLRGPAGRKEMDAQGPV